MRILFDHGTPRGIARSLAGHLVREARAQGWDTLTNGELLNAAEEAGFDLLVTTDQNLRYQQNLAGRKIAIVVLGSYIKRFDGRLSTPMYTSLHSDPLQSFSPGFCATAMQQDQTADLSLPTRALGRYQVLTGYRYADAL